MIVYAINIHVGGGKVLLDSILTDKNGDRVTHVFIDERYSPPKDLANPTVVIHRIKPSVFSRLKAEFSLKIVSCSHPNEIVKSITNMPPLFKMKGPCILFLQNALLLPGNLKYCASLKHKIKTAIEFFILRAFHHNIDKIQVQTPWMKKGLEGFFKKSIEVLPIAALLPPPSAAIKKYDFLTITNSIRYKNVDFLLSSWKGKSELKDKKLLIVSDTLSPKQNQIFNELKKNGFQVFLQTNVSREEIFKIYCESRNLIVTSSIESYCLPLYEGVHFGLKVLAPNLPYVQDAKLPVQTYEHMNKESFLKGVRSLS